MHIIVLNLLNIQCFKTNKNSLEVYINTNNIYFCLLSEIFQYNSNDSNLKVLNYNTISKFRSDGYGGTSIIGKNNIKFKKIAYESEMDVVVIQTLNTSQTLTIISAYFPPNTSVPVFKNEFEKLTSFCEKYTNVILGGDFNARSRTFGDSETSSKGSKLIEILNSSNLHILNNGTYFHDSSLPLTGGSVLDLTFTNNVNLGFSWDVSLA